MKWTYRATYPLAALPGRRCSVVVHVAVERVSEKCRLVCRVGPPSAPLLQRTWWTPHGPLAPQRVLVDAWVEAANHAEMPGSAPMDVLLKEALFDASCWYSWTRPRRARAPRYVRAPIPFDRAGQRHWRRKTGSWRHANRQDYIEALYKWKDGK